MIDSLRTFTQLQSLAWTAPLVIMCGLVVWEVRKKTWHALLHKQKSQMDWILIGIALGFCGKIAESLWWFVPWTLDYIQHPAWDSFNSEGVWVNLIFRQGFFTLAAYCHLRAFVAPHRSEGLRLIHWILLASILIGQLYPVVLYNIKTP